MLGLVAGARAMQAPGSGATSPPASSYTTVIEEPLPAVMARRSAAKAAVMQRQQAFLDARYDLSERPAARVTMSRGQPVQEGVRVRLPAGTTWEALAQSTPAAIRDCGLYPAGFLSLPHANDPEGGMIFRSGRP